MLHQNFNNSNGSKKAQVLLFVVMLRNSYPANGNNFLVCITETNCCICNKYLQFLMEDLFKNLFFAFLQLYLKGHSEE